MNARIIPKIDLEEVMEKIRAEINKKDLTQQSSNSFSNLPRSEQKFLNFKTFPKHLLLKLKLADITSVTF